MEGENFPSAERVAYYALLAIIALIKLFNLFEYHKIEYVYKNLFMIFPASVNHKRAVELFQKNYPHKLVRKSHIRKGEF